MVMERPGGGPHRATTLLVALVSALGVAACDSAEEKKCKGLVSDAETRLLSMNIGDEQSVEFTLAGLEEAKSACQSAKMSDAVADIDEAIKNTSRHLERLETGEFKPPPKPPGPEDLKRLAAEGDPACPLGQGYEHPMLDELIKCKGPRMVEMTWAEAVDYFQKNRFGAAIKGKRLRGARKDLAYEFVFARAQGTEPPVCLVIDAAASQEAAALISFATNVPVEEVRLDAPLEISGREIQLAVEEVVEEPAPSKEGAEDEAAAQGKQAAPGERERHHIVLGDCEAKEPMLKREDSGSPSEASAKPDGKGPEGAGAPKAEPGAEPGKKKSQAAKEEPVSEGE